MNNTLCSYKLVKFTVKVYLRTKSSTESKIVN
jgi:hypothetical protein